MSILGLRASAQEIRFAILEKNQDGSIIFKNRDGENRLKYPASIDTIDEKIMWVKSEVDRILRKNPEITKILIKINEFNGTENTAKRETTYMDAIFLLCSKEHNIPVERKLNSQIASSSAKAKEIAEQRVGKTDKYRNNAMAEAILVAYRGINDGV